MKVLVSYSGGKDSQASLIDALLKHRRRDVKAVFCDTGWEHPETYKHIFSTTEDLKVDLITLKSRFDFVSLAKYKKRFPSIMARFCTQELKIKPMIDYVLSHSESLMIWQGIRASESADRAKMGDECMFFKGYFTPRVTKKGKLVYDTYRKEDVKEWCTKNDASVFRPEYYKSGQDVIDCILFAGQRPNILYNRGHSRVGCYPCLACQLREMLMLSKDEEMCCRLRWAEKEVGRSFFSPGYIPQWACANRKFPSVDEVIKYVTAKNATLDMFEPEEGYSCMSMYHGLCE